MKGVLWNSVSVTVETHSKKQYCFLETNHGLRQNVGHYILMPPQICCFNRKDEVCHGVETEIDQIRIL